MAEAEAEILHEEGDLRIVKMRQEFSACNGTLDMFIGYFSEEEIKIQKTDLHYEHESFRMTHQEMDALISAYAAYKADLAEEAEAEAKRLADVEAEAYRMAEGCKAIQIEKREDLSSWNVAIPDFAWGGRVYNVDELLSTVKDAVEYCRPIQEAYRLAKDYSAIKFEYSRCSNMWHIAIPDLFGGWAGQSNIVQVVQQVIAAYQAKLVREND